MRLVTLVERLYFNSIKVRLERSYRSQELQSAAFQFHKGTIRTFSELNLPSRSIISIP